MIIQRIFRQVIIDLPTIITANNKPQIIINKAHTQRLKCKLKVWVCDLKDTDFCLIGNHKK